MIEIKDGIWKLRKKEFDGIIQKITNINQNIFDLRDPTSLYVRALEDLLLKEREVEEENLTKLVNLLTPTLSQEEVDKITTKLTDLETTKTEIEQMKASGK